MDAIKKPKLPKLAGNVSAVVFITALVMFVGQLFQDHYREEDNIETRRIYIYQQQLAYAGQAMTSILQLKIVSNDVEYDSLEKRIKSSFHGLKYTKETLNQLANELIKLNESDNVLDEETVVASYVEQLIIEINEVMTLLESNLVVESISNESDRKMSFLYEIYQKEVIRVIDHLLENLIEESTVHRQMVWWIVLIVMIIIFIIGSAFYRFSKKQVHAQFNVLSDIQAQLKEDNELRSENEQKIISQAEIITAEHMKLQSILDSTVDAIITITKNGSIESFNKAAEKMFGYTATNIIGKNVKTLMPEPYLSEHDGYLHSYDKTGHKKIIGIGRQVIAKRIDGSKFPIFLSVSEVPLSVPKLFTGIVQDITERQNSADKLQQTMEELTRKQAELEHEEKMACQIFENITKSNNEEIAELASWSQAMLAFSGDMMLSAILPSGEMRVTLCDFTGHGLPAALGAIPVSSIHDAMAKKGLPLEVLVHELNCRLKELLPVNIFCCITVVDIDATRTFARILNAGLPEVLIVSKTGEIKERCKSNYLPLGVIEYDMDEIKSYDVRLDNGDNIYLYSDGLTEAENEAGDMLGQGGFEALLMVESGTDGRLTDIKNKVVSFVGQAVATDDISLIEIKNTGHKG
ncbi:MAG: SpoIIE family protein phosphatase [Piscirickettsiaceae bacterium]|nr:SpoIIE family protein phosphatase [Piscirickettsiaceae bacterium]